METYVKSVPGFLSAYVFAQDADPVIVSEMALEGVLREKSGWVWLHLNLTDQRCGRWLLHNFSISDALITEFVTPARRHYLRETETEWVGQIPAFRRGEAGEPSDGAALSLLVTSNAIITGRTKPLHAPEILRAELHGMTSFQSPVDVLARLLNIFVDTTENFHRDLLEELEIIEDRVLDDRPGEERQRLMVARRSSAKVHRHLRALRRTLVQSPRNHLTWPQALQDATTQLANLDADFDSLEQRARFFHDEIDAKLAAETNRQLYVLSIVTAAFLPPSLVAGLFGMNVEGIPWNGSQHGFWLALAAGLASAVAVGLFISFSKQRR